MAEAELPSAVLEHSRFFDHLVELIPARFYHAEAEDAPPKLRFIRKEDREKEIELRKANSKAAKRAKLDPDQAKTSLQLQQRGARRDDHISDEPPKQTSVQKKSGKKAAPNGKSQQKDSSPGSSEKLDELREKLHKRLEVFKQQREVKEKKEQVEKAKEFRNKSRKPLQQPAKASSGQKRKAAEAKQAENKPVGGQAAGAPPPSDQFSYGQLDFGNESRIAAKRQKKLSKAELLQEAEKKASERSGMAASAAGQEKLQKEAWSSALARAKGEKIYDDPKLLRKSLKKEEKKRSKSATAWQERERQQQQEGKERQQKRRDNLQARAQAKQQKKIDKREKKLMRPGFEGRRDTFINGP